MVVFVLRKQCISKCIIRSEESICISVIQVSEYSLFFMLTTISKKKKEVLHTYIAGIPPRLFNVTLLCQSIESGHVSVFKLLCSTSVSKIVFRT
jgi:hypothetical protein